MYQQGAQPYQQQGAQPYQQQGAQPYQQQGAQPYQQQGAQPYQQQGAQPYQQQGAQPYQQQAGPQYRPQGGQQYQQQGGPGQNAPNQQQQQQLWSWFATVDADKSGHITANELQQALTNANWSHFNKETCRLMIGMFDRDHSGTIDFNEFCGLWNYIQQWKGVFDRYDNDRSGSIEEGELHRALNEMGFRLSQAFVHLVIVKFDTLSKRGLKFDDFIQCCVMLRGLTESFRQKDTNLSGQITVSYEDFMCMVLSNNV